MKNVVVYFFLLLGVVSCSKSKEARALEDQLNNTRWELYLIEDSLGNDITAQVLEDSLICECFELFEYEQKQNNFNASLSKCHNTFFKTYLGGWVLVDWWRSEKRGGSDRSKSLKPWLDFAIAVGNVGYENSSDYLGGLEFSILDDSDLISQPRYYEENGWRPTNILLETRYYRKVK